MVASEPTGWCLIGETVGCIHVNPCPHPMRCQFSNEALEGYFPWAGVKWLMAFDSILMRDPQRGEPEKSVLEAMHG